MTYHALGISSGLYAVLFAAVSGVARGLDVSAHWVGLSFFAAEILFVVFATYVVLLLLTRQLNARRRKASSGASAAP